MKKIFALYILSLLAGKFEEICTAFPLTTFSAKNSKWLPFRFYAKSYVNIFSCKKTNQRKANFFLTPRKSQRTTFLIPKYFQEIKFGIKHYPQKHCSFRCLHEMKCTCCNKKATCKFYSKQ